jgi:hypothetical protein
LKNGYSVLDELTDTQVNLLEFYAGKRPLPPRGSTPWSIKALEWRGLIERRADDRDRLRATSAGAEAVAALNPSGGNPSNLVE